MNKLLMIWLIFNTSIVSGQNVVEQKRIEVSKEFMSIVEKAKLYKDSSIYKKIENLESGLLTLQSKYERYRIIVNTLSGYYTATKQYDKAIDLWIAGNKEGLFFPFDPKDDYYPYLQEYINNKRFLDFLAMNDTIKNRANVNSKAEYFVNLPINYNVNLKYPIIIILSIL